MITAYEPAAGPLQCEARLKYLVGQQGQGELCAPFKNRDGSAIDPDRQYLRVQLGVPDPVGFDLVSQLLDLFDDGGPHVRVGVVQALRIGELDLRGPLCTWQMLMNQSSLLPEVCVATTTSQTVLSGASSQVGSHWKVREGHFILWTTSLSQRQPLFFTQIWCFSQADTPSCSFIWRFPVLNIMIREIVLSSRAKRQLYKNKLVCGCLYRSFSDLEATIFFKFAGNNLKLTRSNINDMAAGEKAMYSQGNPHIEKLVPILETFKTLEIVRTIDNNSFTMDHEFAKNVEEFLRDPMVMQPVALEEAPAKVEPKPFEFLSILLDNKMPSSCKIEGLSQQTDALTREQFLYIKSDISYKISTLIDGIINAQQADSTRNIEAIVMLNLLDSDLYYPRLPELNPLLEELRRIKLVQVCGDCFRISRYLEHFTFRDSMAREAENKLNCKIIIETNFKVFAVIKSADQQEAKVIKRILSLLLKSEREGIEYEELFIGEVEKIFMRDVIFKRTRITTNEYFDFFRQYTDETHSLAKDLGKWKKLKYIGLEGPSEESNIPNNIKQEVKLWEHLKNSDEYNS